MNQTDLFAQGAITPETLLNTNASPLVSPRYHFISTQSILSEMQKLEFKPVSYTEKRAVSPQRRGFQKHIVRLRRSHDVLQVRDSVAELVIVNSHDGSSALSLSAGIFRLVCSNGLMASLATVPEVRIIHRDYSLPRLQAGVEEIARQLPVLERQVDTWQILALRPARIAEFAERATALRWPTSKTQPRVAPAALTVAKRPEDSADTLWNVYNRVQEKLINGGFEVTFGSRKHPSIARAVTGIDRIIDINRTLWQLAAEYANN